MFLLQLHSIPYVMCTDQVIRLGDGTSREKTQISITDVM
jgi:hypothetical protein